MKATLSWTNPAVNIKGGALNSLSKIQIFLDEKLVGDTTTGMPRIDIDEKYSTIENSYESWFNFQLGFNQIQNGTHQIKEILLFISHLPQKNNF